jgi:hypothetical protein
LLVHFDDTKNDTDRYAPPLTWLPSLNLVHNAPQVGGVLGSPGFDGRNGVSVANLFAPERSRPIGIT